MSYNNYNREFELNEKKAEEFLLNAVEKVESEEDVDTLTELIAIFKRTVPLTRRKYVKAYLLKEALKHYHSYSKSSKGEKSSGRNTQKNKNENREYKNAARAEKQVEVQETAVEAEAKPRHPRVEIDPALATSIFVSIGKNRRVYPRDLVGLLVAVGGIDRERIGDIKVLANYSFVQLYTEDCQTAIDKLNGYDYRGRKLAVSFSRQKDDEAVESDAVDQISDDEAEMSAEDAVAYAAAEKAAADKEPFGNI